MVVMVYAGTAGQRSPETPRLFVIKIGLVRAWVSGNILHSQQLRHPSNRNVMDRQAQQPLRPVAAYRVLTFRHHRRTHHGIPVNASIDRLVFNCSFAHNNAPSHSFAVALDSASGFPGSMGLSRQPACRWLDASLESERIFYHISTASYQQKVW